MMIRHPRKLGMSFDGNNVYLQMVSVPPRSTIHRKGVSRIHELFIIGPCSGVQAAVHRNGGFLVISLQNGEHLGDGVDYTVGVVSAEPSM